MSTGGRITLAVVCSLVAIAFTVLAAFYGDYFPSGPWSFYGLTAFCALIALACLVRASQPVALRIIGVVVFGAFALYVYDSSGGPNFWRALAAFGVFGLPAGYVVVTGNYPRWGKAAGAFGHSPSRNEEREEQH